MTITSSMTINTSKLHEARKVKIVPSELYDLCEFLVGILPNQITPRGLVSYTIEVMEALLASEEEYCGKYFSMKLKNERYRLAIYMNYFPLIVDELASQKFSQEFRENFDNAFGESLPPIVNEGEYGVTVISRDVVDISNKDKAEVLAALYNYSHPTGAGVLDYDPSPMSVEEAKELLKEGSYFDVINGRVMKVNLARDIVITYAYNRENGDSSAERIISHCCRNIE